MGKRRDGKRRNKTSKHSPPHAASVGDHCCSPHTVTPRDPNPTETRRTPPAPIRLQFTELLRRVKLEAGFSLDQVFHLRSLPPTLEPIKLRTSSDLLPDGLQRCLHKSRGAVVELKTQQEWRRGTRRRSGGSGTRKENIQK